MNVQPERCDRTAYVSGLQQTVTDIELFEVFNRVAHVEKVIVRNGSVRHALVVFKTVEGLYQALLNFQGTSLHSRQLHIRPLRESSHNNGTGNGVSQNQNQRQNNYQKSSSYRPSPTHDQHQHSSYSSYNRSQNHQNTHQNSSYQPRGYRMQSGSGTPSYQGAANGQRRRYGAYGYNRNGLQNETYPLAGYEKGHQYGQQYSDGGAYQQHLPYHQNPAHQHDFHFEDHAEGAKRFDNLANLIRATTPTDPFALSAKFQKSSDSSISPPSSITRTRTSSSTHHQKNPPPAWKMELPLMMTTKAPEAPPTHKELSMGQQEFLAHLARQTVVNAQDGGQKKKRPNLSVINPSLFYEQYPRTSSPVVKTSAPSTDKSSSPHDPAVIAYSRLRVPQSAFDALSPIDTNNCSFITKHLGPKEHPKQRDLTNEELSDMIVSTGNLRIMPIADSFETPPKAPESPEGHIPAPWSPLKRLRAESGSLSAAPLASPQFSPIQPKMEDSGEIDDDVFARSVQKEEVLADEQKKMPEFEDINNSRLPSNSHSAAPSSEQKSFVFPEYPMCRHSSVPSIAHLVGDLSDFCPPSPHFAEKMANNDGSESQSSDVIDKTSEEKSSTSSEDGIKIQKDVVLV